MNRKLLLLVMLAFAAVAVGGFAVMSESTVAQEAGFLDNDRPVGTNTRQTSNELERATVESTAESSRTKGFALIELFTSEGCSSCPSADANLTRLHNEAARAGVPVYALSFHVDYWNYLGWKDPFSHRSFSDRQREYSETLDSGGRVYTPQMVVNGRLEFVGSNRRLADRAVQAALRVEPSVRLEVSANRSGQRVDVQLSSSDFGSATIVNVALVQNSGSRAVNAGENRGRRLRHVNIVRDFEVLRARTQNVSLLIPKDATAGSFRVIAYAQDRNRSVLGAASTDAS